MLLQEFASGDFSRSVCGDDTSGNFRQSTYSDAAVAEPFYYEGSTPFGQVDNLMISIFTRYWVFKIGLKADNDHFFHYIVLSSSSYGIFFGVLRFTPLQASGHWYSTEAEKLGL